MSTKSAKEAGKRHYRELKRRVLEHYSCYEGSQMKPGILAPRCGDCGEEDLDLLTLHYSPGDGKLNRKELGYGRRFLEALEARGYPAGFVVLCANCDLRKRKQELG